MNATLDFYPFTADVLGFLAPPGAVRAAAAGVPVRRNRGLLCSLGLLGLALLAAGGLATGQSVLVATGSNSHGECNVPPPGSRVLVDRDVPAPQRVVPTRNG